VLITRTRHRLTVVKLFRISDVLHRICVTFTRETDNDDASRCGLVVKRQRAGLLTERSQDRLRAGALSGSDLGQVVHTYVPLFAKQYNLVGLPVKERWRSAVGKVTVGLASH